MRALHVINSLVLGGAERLISELLPAMAGAGIESRAFALDERGDAFSKRLRDAGIQVEFARKGGASPYAPARLADVAAAIARERPDIVHAHLGPSFHWCALAGGRGRDYGLLATEHASANRRMDMPFLRGFERFCHGRYDRIACVSEDAASALEHWLGLERAKLPVIQNGIPLERFREAKPAMDVAAALRGRKGIAMVARMVPVKDHATALAALALLPEDFTLVLAGDGPERPAIEARVRELGLGERCLFLGGRDDVPAVLAASACYLQTSKVEGFGIAALEAMAAGIPVAASEVPGLAGLVRGAGSLFSPGDAAGCAAAIRGLVEDSARRAALARSGRERARAYSIETTARAYAGLYEDILRERAAGAGNLAR